MKHRRATRNIVPCRHFRNAGYKTGHQQVMLRVLPFLLDYNGNVLWHTWVWIIDSLIGVKVPNSNGSILLAEAKLENQNHKHQQKAVPESVNK